MHVLMSAAVLFAMLALLSACGVAETDECENPHPAKKAECDVKDSTEWDKMKWNESNWG